MAGRFPVGSKLPQVAAQMEAVFVHNLKYAADVFSKVGDFDWIWTFHTNKNMEGGVYR